MILVTNNTEQTLAPNQTATFPITQYNTSNCCCNRTSTTSVKLCDPGIYQVVFSGNVTANAAGEVELSIALGGEVIPWTAANASIATPGNFTRLTITAPIKICCNDFDRITVVNTGTIDVSIRPNASLYILKEC